MLKTPSLAIDRGLKMVKNKRDLKSPRRNRSFTGRPVARTRSTTNSDGGNMRVLVRVRPANSREQGDNFINVIKVADDHTMVFDPKEEDDPFFYQGVQQRYRDIMKRANKNLRFTFDKVFSHEAQNADVFENSTKGLIQTLMNGYNCSVFVYGATGAGKTHTMLGSRLDPGITFLTMYELFRQKNELSEERQFEIGMTYLEVYNEAVQDLLNPGPALNLREDSKYGVIVAGIQVQRIESSEQLFELLEQGNRNRTQHPTDANAESSRSHAVFQVYLRMKFVASGEIRLAKLSMIDLAGSERGAATGYSGARFTEGANINKSLLALGNCINSLADGLRHVPYRDSKLTRLLKDSLGGNCQTVMIANVSPSSLSYEDTYNTLKYAMRAKKIKSHMKKNVVNSEGNLNYYRKLADDLAKENEQLKLQLSLSLNKPCSSNETITREEPDPKLETELQALYAEKKELENRVLQLQSTQQLYVIRKQLKEESDARLSGICNDTPDKELGHRRLGNAVDRLERQTSTVQAELIKLHVSNEQLGVRILEFLQKAPHLETLAEKENTQIACIKANNKAEHLQKVCDLQSGELRMRDQLIERFSEVLKPCFLQLRGHGYATESLMTSYQGLIRHLQGIRSVTWDDETASTDSAISTCMTVSDQEEKDTPSTKRKLEEEVALDNTFVLPEEKAPTISAEKFMAKVYTSPPDEPTEVPLLDHTRVLSQSKQPAISAKRIMAKVYKPSATTKVKFNASPRMNKENRIAFQSRPIPQDKNKIIKAGKPRAKSTVRCATSVTHK